VTETVRKIAVPDAEPVPEVDLDRRTIEILYQVGEALGEDPEAGHILEQLATLAMRATGAERCGVFLADADATKLVPIAGAVREGNKDLLGRRFKETEPIDVSIDAPWEVFGTDPGPFVVDDPQSSPLIPESWKEWGSKSIALAVMRARGTRFGILAVDYVTRPHKFVPSEERLLDAIASAAGIALHTARSVEREAHARDLQRYILECSAARSAGKSLSSVLEVAVAGFSSLLDATQVRIFLVDENREVLRAVASLGGSTSTGDILLTDLPTEGVGYVRHAWERDPRRAITIPSVHALKEWRHVVPDGTDTAVLFPLAEGVDTVGVAVVGRTGAPFTEQEISAGSALADQAAASVSYARVNEERQGRLRVMETVYGLSDVVVGALDFGSLLAQLNKWLKARSDIQCVRVSFVDPFLREVLELAPETEQDLALIRRWRGARATRVQSPTLVPYREGDQVGFPILVEARVAGIFWVRAPNRLREDEVALIRVLASGIGEAAFKLKLRRIVERRSQELAVSAERERIARDLHDTVGQALYGIGLKLEDMIADITDPVLVERLSELRALASRGVAEVRSAVYALSFLHVRAKGMVSSLRALARQFTRTTGVPVIVRIDKKLPQLSEDTESAIYRTVHEALVNVDRHARATGVVLSLSAHGAYLELKVQDDGVGLDQRQVRDWRSAAHFGLRTMAKSIEEVGGKFDARAVEPRGLAIRAVVPVRDPVSVS
jgi:signal transduction histidine kinase